MLKKKCSIHTGREERFYRLYHAYARQYCFRQQSRLAGTTNDESSLALSIRFEMVASRRLLMVLEASKNMLESGMARARLANHNSSFLEDIPQSCKKKNSTYCGEVMFRMTARLMLDLVTCTALAKGRSCGEVRSIHSYFLSIPNWPKR